MNDYNSGFFPSIQDPRRVLWFVRVRTVYTSETEYHMVFHYTLTCGWLRVNDRSEEVASKGPLNNNRVLHNVTTRMRTRRKLYDRALAQVERTPDPTET